MIILSADQVVKSYGSNLVLDGLSFEIQDHDRIGIVGRNGVGKTTLFKILSGIEAADQGSVHIKRGLRIGYLEQIPEVPTGYDGKAVLQMAFESLIVLENKIGRLSEELSQNAERASSSVTSEQSEKLPEWHQIDQKLHLLDQMQKEFELRGGYEMDIQLNRIVEGLKIKESLLKQDFQRMSGGEKTRILLGRILLEAPDLLLLDEPTNHLDLEALEWLETYLSSYNGAMLMISHDRQFLDQTATKILEFEDRICKLWLGNYSKYKLDRDEWLRIQIETYKQQQKKVRAMEEAILRFEDWGTRVDNKAMFVKARNMQKRIDRMEKIEKPKTKEKKMGLSFNADGRTGNIVFRLEGVSAGYGNEPLFTDVDLEVNYQDRVVLMGANGIGKTTLFKLLIGSLQPMNGQIRIGSKVKIGYLEQEVSFERQERTLLELYNEETMIGEYTARGKLARFMFFSEDLSKKVNTLSGGERVRLKLCLMMEQGINVLLMDEPTNHMDIPSREILEMAIAEFKGTVVMISHDRYFIKQLADRLIFLSPNGMDEHDGDYEDWRSSEKQNDIVRKMPIETASVKNLQGGWRDQDARAKQNEVRRIKKRLEVLNAEIEKLENELVMIGQEIDENQQNYDKLMLLCDLQKKNQENLETATLEWIELAEVVDES